MNPTPSDSFTADVFMEFEDNASGFAEPEFVPTPAASAPPSVVAQTPTLEQLKTQIAALTPQEHAELARFITYLLGLSKPAGPAPASPPAAAP